MKLSNLNEWLSLIANVGVLVGLVFIVIELQQNSSMIRSQTRDSMTEKQLGFYSLVIENPVAAEVLSKSRLEGFEYQPGQVEYTRFAFLVFSQFRMWENEFYQYNQGLFDAPEFESRIEVMKQNLANIGYVELWKQQENTFSPSFREFLNQLIIDTSSIMSGQ